MLGITRFPCTTARVALPGALALLLLAAPASAQPPPFAPGPPPFAPGPPPAAPGPPLAGEGTGAIATVEITSSREAGGNRIESRELTGTVTGTLDGEFVEHVSGVVHRDGRVTFSGTMVFTGTVGECGEGTITLGLSGQGEVPVPGFPITEASVRVIEQAANTVAVTGVGTVQQEGVLLTYAIQYVCR
jgi:hypothetical protein